jgi:hypothetical protein
VDLVSVGSAAQYQDMGTIKRAALRSDYLFNKYLLIRSFMERIYSNSLMNINAEINDTEMIMAEQPMVNRIDISFISFYTSNTLSLEFRQAWPEI